MIEKTAGRILGGLCAIMLAGASVDVAQAGETAGIPPEMVAEYIHAIIQADRTLYSTHVVERLQDLKVTVSAEDWKAKGTLPLPAQMLQMAGQESSGARPRSSYPVGQPGADLRKKRACGSVRTSGPGSGGKGPPEALYGNHY